MEEMHQHGPTPSLKSHNLMLIAFNTVGRFDEAKAYLGVMRSHGVEPDIVSYNTVLMTGAGLGDMPKTLGFLEVSYIHVGLIG